MQPVEARVLDSVHLELKQPMHFRRGRRVTVQVQPIGVDRARVSARRAAALEAIRRLFAAAPRKRSLVAELIAERRREARVG